MNERHHYDLAIIRTGDTTSIKLSYKIGGITHQASEEVIGNEKIYLRVTGTPEMYTFYFARENENFIKLGEMETRYLSSEVAGGFTGVFLGMYATGNGRINSVPADFNWFEYKKK